MPILKVGELYNPNRRRWPEGAQFQYRGGQAELVLFYPDPSRHEIEAVRKGSSEFGLVVEPPLVVLLYTFGAAKGIPWCDAPFSYHRLKAARPTEAVLPPAWEEGSPETRAILQVLLVDASSGILRAMRAVSLSPEFTRTLHRAIWEQAHREEGPGEFDRALNDLYTRFPTSERLLTTAVARTTGGA